MARENDFPIPREVSEITSALESAGFEAYLVGGCVRDLIRKEKPRDWDITTNAKPEEILALFPHAFYENNFGTVGIVHEGIVDKTLEVVEVTTYRLDGVYKDSRRPETVVFSHTINDDLKRRDFTINAIAYGISKEELIDPFGGQEDTKKKIIRAVGNPLERFNEDALRILRGVRFSAELGFAIEHETREDIKKTASALKNIAKERIRDEFVRILNSPRPREALILAHELGVLPYITPKLEEGIGVEQNQAHKYNVWEHGLRALQHAAEKEMGSIVRLSALFHDIGKPQARRWSNDKKDWTFYGHDVIGAKIVKAVLTDLKFPKQTIEDTTKLVRWHMFFSDTEKITLSAVRRLLRNVGEEHVWNLMDLRACDRIGTGRPKENPYRFRKYKAMVEEVLQDPITVAMLKIDGNDLMKILSIQPGPKIGHILHTLLEEVLDDPSRNVLDSLTERSRELAKLSEKELQNLGKSGKKKKEDVAEEERKKIHKKYWVE